MDYQNGRIYRLVSPSGLQYIGSTTQALAKRKWGHKDHFKRWQKDNQNFMTSFKLFEEGPDDVEIVLLEIFPCNSKEELLSRERHWIETIEGGCVNKQIPTRTKQEYHQANADRIHEKQKKYHQANAEQIRERKKQHYQTNADQIREQKKQKITCACGCEVRRGGFTEHQRTQKHINLMSQQST